MIQRIRRGLLLSPEDMEAAWAERERHRLESEKRLRRQSESVELVVGIHLCCGGELVYSSSFVDVAPLGGLVGSGHSPQFKEVVSCWCKECGSGISNPQHLAEYAKVIADYRNRVTD